MTKLTLSVDEEVVAQAKRLAKENGRSVSAMFTQYVRAMAQRRSRPVRGGYIARQALGLLHLPKDRSYRDLLVDALKERYGLR
ncbi:MAG: hypothetical protein FJ290_23585 [Planctomycetes bacterium]|nr:hypothetical protein [Planctomycetota bacterium]